MPRGAARPRIWCGGKKPKQCIQRDCRDPIFGVHVSHGSAETYQLGEIK